ncbi:MAG TPA: tRNA-intron lyase [Candidatus Bathyarchaeota archaeon]|nr:tRNA-intron lyase [Candidatus Bathyarchaeota archaeon]
MARAELLGSFLVIWDVERARAVYRLGFFGKPLGIPKPRGPDFNAPLILDLMEGLYLLEKGEIEVYEGSSGREVSPDELKEVGRSIHEDFDLKYAVYKDLRDSGLVVTTGIKFGCDFAVYRLGPGLEHAPYLVSVRRPTDSITAPEVVRAGRLATTVRKRFVIALVDERTGDIRYLMFKWFRA